MSNAASQVSRYDRIDGDADDAPPFWLYDPEGDPVVIPPGCVGFQVRFWAPNQRGMGTVVVDVRNGRPLILPRSTSPDEFAERVGYKVGRYRLFLLDGGHRRMDCNPAQLEITPEMAAARGVAEGAPMVTPATSPASEAITLAQVLAFFERINAQAFAQMANAQHELAESQRATLAHLGGVVGPVSGVLTAAGTAGVIKKTLALDAAAAGAPVTVQMVSAANANDAAGAPRNACATASPASSSSGVADALMALGLPLVEKLGPVLAYGAARKLDVPEEYARGVAGVVQTTAQTARQMMTDEPTTPKGGGAAAAAVGELAREGAELMAHLGRIQAALSDDERAWVFGLMRRPGLVDALKPSVASLTVEEGVGAVRNLRAMEAAMQTDHERRMFELLLAPEQLPTVFRRLFVDAPTEQAIAHMRQHAARIAEIAAAKAAPEASG